MSKTPVRRSRRVRAAKLVLAAISLLACWTLGWLWWTAPGPQDSQVIYPGITYACVRYDKTTIKGLGHLVTVDLLSPGLDLYVTPLDPEAVAAGWQYRTRWLPGVVKAEDLIIGINGTLFEKDAPRWAVWPGHWARSLETIVADHEVSHVDPHSYLLWFDDHLLPHLETTKPLPQEALKRARWGIGGQMVLLDKGQINKFAGHDADARTAIGFSTYPPKLYLAVFEHASGNSVGQVLAEMGATEAIMLDGGDSSCLVWGPKARPTSRRMVRFPHQAHVTVFGVRSTSPRKVSVSLSCHDSTFFPHE